MKYAQIFALGTILAMLSLLFGGGCSTDDGDPASPSDRLRCAFVTPMLAYSDTGLVRRQADALRSAGYNAVCSLIDLQTADGKRDYVTAGRMATRSRRSATPARSAWRWAGRKACEWRK